VILAGIGSRVSGLAALWLEHAGRGFRWRQSGRKFSPISPRVFERYSRGENTQ